jgi:hypothetical protein
VSQILDKGFRCLHAEWTTTESYLKSREIPPLSVSVYPGGSNDIEPVTITRSRRLKAEWSA